MRLIDARELEETLIGELASSLSKRRSLYEAADDLLYLLHAAPAIDAVPVVRCKDCRHRGDGDVCPMRHIFWSEEEGYYFVDITMDDYYCSFGERKDNHEID